MKVFDIQIQISSNFDLFSVGSKYGYSLKENKLEVGASLLIGGDIEISAEKIERGWMLGRDIWNTLGYNDMNREEKD